MICIKVNKITTNIQAIKRELTLNISKITMSNSKEKKGQLLKHLP